MNKARFLGGAALAMTSAWAMAQDAPESLLPPGFENPAPAPAPAPATTPTPAPRATGNSGGSGPATVSNPVVQPIPGGSTGSSAQSSQSAPSSTASSDYLDRLPTLEELETLSPEELEDALGLKPKFDIPPAARRSLSNVGIVGEAEGGFSAGSVAGQDASLVRATLAGNRGMMVSRWGHILLRRALASRLAAPANMDPVEFAALRARLLLRMGEAEAARAMVQDIDTGSYSPQLRDAAFDAYVATADFTGVCPSISTQGQSRDDPQWEVARQICNAFKGESRSALSRLDRQLARESMPRVDLLLAQKYVGAAGKARRAVTIEWDEVTEMTPWRYGLTVATGLHPPDRLMDGASPRYAYMAALAPMLGLSRRAQAADRAAGAGVLSSTAMIDLYGQLYADPDIDDEWSARAENLRDAYVAASPAARFAAIQGLWNSTAGEPERYSRQVLTSHAAARLPVSEDFADAAPDLIASMLTAGLDRNAMRWASLAENGSQAWALLALAAPSSSNAVDRGALDTFFDNDDSEDARKSAFLLAALAGLGRVSDDTATDFAQRLEIGLSHNSRWSQAIDRAAEVNNPTLVALLAGLGMQGSGWDKMTPRYLYHIVSALRRVGLEAEARMIATEAVARA